MTLATAFRLVITAVVAYLVADLLRGGPPPLLAPLTALLIVQVTLYQTLTSSIQRIASVTTGVILAVVIAGPLGFHWWTLGLVIALALLVGRLFKLGDHILEVPISAMLILQLGTESAALGRVVETLIGAGVGLISTLLTAPVKVKTAEDALRKLAMDMGQFLEDLADDLHLEPDHAHTTRWQGQAARLSEEARTVGARLGEADDSTRLNPRAYRIGGPSAALRTAMSTLEAATIKARGLARCMADRTYLYLRDGEGGLGTDMWATDVRQELGLTLRTLSRAVPLYAATATAASPESGRRLGQTTHELLVEARQHRERLGRLLRDDPGHWPLHGELLVHLDRILDSLAPAELGFRPVMY
ncbi:FUSC family protein [Actinocorallia sp. A-T 12471]|uniref:FUSC family protein n=1 Tax=Actinocorallia sp. A-T 12471 TaxID=3089813 RepID=UPI0029D22A00|nr:aromatic acid exporter family protein [Actinocorallia sp. A-T 12471]MDX6738474.1 aromatic acid exporter family protein [Actinocorallia sp. A-T 12471]